MIRRFNRAPRQLPQTLVRLLRVGQKQPETVVRISALGVVPVSGGGATSPGAIEPGTAAQNAKTTAIRSGGIANRARRIVVEPVETPFPNTPVHIVKSPGVRRLLSDRTNLTPRIAAVPTQVV